jgi:hypothetical protein
MSNLNRVNAGIPTGGQFASHYRAEAGTTLLAPRHVIPETDHTGRGSLSELMDFDHVIRVVGDGVVDLDTNTSRYAPTIDVDLLGDIDYRTLDSGWQLLQGYTGQHGYSGPVMHSSEQISGRIAEDIASKPGLYVAVVVESETCDDYDALGFCDDPVGWAIAYHEDEMSQPAFGEGE